MTTKIIKNTIIRSTAVAVIALGFFLLINNQKINTTHAALLENVEITVYKSPTCGCCGEYISYLKNQGARVSVQETEKMNDIKSQYKVPVLLESCHTSIIGDYVVEGHVPAEAIRKLLDERPTIAGISLPEMPAGSPGMGGTKFAPFRIHSIDSTGKDAGIFVEL